MHTSSGAFYTVAIMFDIINEIILFTLELLVYIILGCMLIGLVLLVDKL